MMNGLGMPPEEMAAPPSAPAGADPMADPMMDSGDEMTPGTEPASPEEQAMYDKFVSLALLALYDDKMMPRTVAHLTKQGNKAAAVGEVAAGIFQRVHQSAKESGAQVTGDVLINAVAEIVEATVELSDKKAGTDLTPEQIDEALYKAMDVIRKMMKKSGDYTDEMKGEDAAALQAMSESGEIDRLTGGSGRRKPEAPADPAMPADPAAMPAEPAMPAGLGV
jgi:hypothetical protein